jgi:hypothetical protein
MNTTMKGYLAVILAAAVCALVSTGVASAANVLTLCITAGGKVVSAPTCKSNETEFKVVSAADFDALDARVTTLEGQVSTLQGKVSALETLLAGVTRANDTLRFSAMNLQVVNGSGLTGTKNGLGNIIIGYNTNFFQPRTGSHNLVIGDLHTYTGNSGVVTGTNNFLEGDEAFVAGGHFNYANGDRSFVGGGTLNGAVGLNAFVGGGALNGALGSNTFVGGGRNNIARDPNCGIVFSTVFTGVCP